VELFCILKQNDIMYSFINQLRIFKISITMVTKHKMRESHNEITVKET